MRTGRNLHQAVAALAAGMLLAGCGGPSDTYTEDGRLVLTYWEKWTGFEQDAMQAVVDDYNASQERVFVEMLAVSEIDRKLLLACAGGNPPDIAGVWAATVNVYAEKGALLPLNRRIREKGISKDHYIPVYWEMCRHRGFNWALPSTPATVALHWNKALFRKAGLDPNKPPASLEELDDIAEQLTIVEVNRDGKTLEIPFRELTRQERETYNFDIVQLGYTPTWPGWWTEIWGYWFGADLWDGDETVTANSTENIAAFDWYGSYARKYGIDNLRNFASTFGNFASPQSPFLSGQVCMTLQGVWLYNFIDKYAPHLEWAAAPFPSIDPDALPQVTLADCDMLVIPKGTRHAEEAFDFIAYVNSRQAMEKLCMGQRKFSPLRETSDDFARQHPNPYISMFRELAFSPNARPTPRVGVWNELARELRVASDNIFSGLTDTSAALAKVNERAQWKMDRILTRWDRVEEERLEQWTAYDAR